MRRMNGSMSVLTRENGMWILDERDFYDITFRELLQGHQCRDVLIDLRDGHTARLMLCGTQEVMDEFACMDVPIMLVEQMLDDLERTDSEALLRTPPPPDDSVCGPSAVGDSPRCERCENLTSNNS